MTLSCFQKPIFEKSLAGHLTPGQFIAAYPKQRPSTVMLHCPREMGHGYYNFLPHFLPAKLDDVGIYKCSQLSSLYMKLKHL